MILSPRVYISSNLGQDIQGHCSPQETLSSVRHRCSLTSQGSAETLSYFAQAGFMENL